MTIYVRGENPIWFFNNLTGQTLDDTYWAFFLTNDLPYIPQAVYQDPNGITPWSNPIEFQPSGGLPNNLYFDPAGTYRIEIRQGPTQADPLIWLIQNYVPGAGSGGGGTSDALISAPNLITNPQFADIYIPPVFTYTQGSPGTYTLNIGPGWQLVLTGAGTTVITQGTLAGNSNTQGNPPYFIEINNSGWTTAVLTQQLNNNGAIFANGAIAIAFAAQSISTAETIAVNYVPNGTANSQTIFSGQIQTGGFQNYYGAIGTADDPMNASVNTNVGTAANVQIQFVLPGTGNIELTNIQVVGQSVPLSSAFVAPSQNDPGSVPLFQELTYEQVVNAEFHTYKNSAVLQSKDTIITGWDFGLNPFQFGGTPGNIAVNKYVADQTIAIQQAYVASGTGNNISVGRSSAQFNYGLLVTAVTANNQFGILNYVDSATMHPYWNSAVSSMVQVLFASTHGTTGVKMKMRLIWSASVPTAHSPEGAAQNYPVLSWSAAGDPVFAAGWTAIVPPNDPAFELTPNALNTFSFNGISLPGNNGSTIQPLILGVFLYTTGDTMDETATADFMVIQDVSLVQNDFGLPSNPKTFDQVFRECQYYYEQSFQDGQTGTATYNGALTVNAQVIPSGGNLTLAPKSFTLTYQNLKRTIPTPKFYSPKTATADKIYLAINNTGTGVATDADFDITDWTSIGSSNTSYKVTATSAGSPLTVAAFTNYDGYMLYQYVADCRLGVSST